MANLFEKGRALILGNLHSLFDAAIDMNSIAVIKQHIRDLETARHGISAQLAVATGRTRSLSVEIVNLEREIKDAQENIDLLLGDDDASNDAHAVTIQLRLDTCSAKLVQKREDLTAATTSKEGLAQAVEKVRTRHQEMVNRVQQLEQQERSAAANEQAASALEQAATLSNMDNAVSVDNVTTRLEERSATAKARLDQALGNLTTDSGESVALAKAKQAIAARKASMGKPASAAA